MKIILWGYPLHTDTYSYIHEAFKKSFEFLGHEVYWFHDKDYPIDFDYENCVFITEGYADKNIPLVKSSTYFVHVCINPQKYLGSVKRLVDIRYHADRIQDTNYDYVLDQEKCESLESGVLVDKQSLNQEYTVCYLAWASNLLPQEIDFDWAHIQREKYYAYIGTIAHDGKFKNSHLIEEFLRKCASQGISFFHSDPWRNPMDDQRMRKIIQGSLFSPDLRNDTHKEWGVKSCRIFKAISCGHLGLTNSSKLANFIDDSIIFSDDISELFDKAMSQKDNFSLIKHQMNIVKTSHTYVNRSKGLLKIL